MVKRIVLLTVIGIFSSSAANAFCQDGMVPDPNRQGRCIKAAPKPSDHKDYDKYGGPKKPLIDFSGTSQNNPDGKIYEGPRDNSK